MEKPEPDAQAGERNDDNDKLDNERSVRKQRRNLGRMARRRRKKASEIEAQSVLKKRSDAGSSGILPTDRAYTLPSVKELSDLSPEDEKLLTDQLGYLPGNALSVVARLGILGCDTDEGVDRNSPLVAKLYPLAVRDECDGKKSKRKRRRVSTNTSAECVRDKSEDSDNQGFPSSSVIEPFPTMYWVTHPYVRALISKLELEKLGTELESRLVKDESMIEKMKLAHEKYGRERHGLLTSQDKEWIKERKWEAAFAESRGVAGIRNRLSVKCLHAHAAHFWSGCADNIIGELVANAVKDKIRTSKEACDGSIRATHPQN